MELTTIRVARATAPGKLPRVEPVAVARVGPVENAGPRSLFVFVAELPALLIDGGLAVGDLYDNPIPVLQQNGMGHWLEVHVLRLWEHTPDCLYARLHVGAAVPVAAPVEDEDDNGLPF